MKYKQVASGIVVGLVVGLLIGNYIGVKQARKMVDQLRAELLPNRREGIEPRIVDMAVAIEQVRKAAQARGFQISEIRAQDSRAVRMQIVNGPAVILHWREMGVDSDASRRELDNKLNNLNIVLKKANEVRAPLGQVELTK